MIRGPIHQEELMVTDMHLPLRAVRDIKKKMAKQNCNPVGPTTLTGRHNNAPLSGDRESSTKWSQMIPKWMQFKKKKISNCVEHSSKQIIPLVIRKIHELINNTKYILQSNQGCGGAHL